MSVPLDRALSYVATLRESDLEATLRFLTSCGVPPDALAVTPASTQSRRRGRLLRRGWFGAPEQRSRLLVRAHVAAHVTWLLRPYDAGGARPPAAR